ncbi:class I SAM-dependent methyltransferase [Paenibacillus harenae]|uniref:class I SAM-dependent methyltransferase n=1 Tax=Paenibacillus harenae TaxID=306543 RepID=UPI0004276A3D|nr:class I SAM-dependent methyltransferase [Paenibacillus harenae]
MREKVEIVLHRRLLACVAYLFGEDYGVNMADLEGPDEEEKKLLQSKGIISEKDKLLDKEFGYACYEYYRQIYAPDRFDRLLIKEAENRRQILDLCCGGGATVWSLLRNEPELVYALDRNVKQLELLEALLRTLQDGGGGVVVKAADAHQLPLGNDAVDFVVCRAALQYLDADRALEEMNRVLSPRGKVFLLVHGSGYPWHYLFKRKGIFMKKSAGYVLQKVLGFSRRGSRINPSYPSQSRFLTKSGLTSSLLAAGFREVRVYTEPQWTVFGGLPVYFAVVAEK